MYFTNLRKAENCKIERNDFRNQDYLVQIDMPYTKSELMRGDVDNSGDLENF